MRALGILALLLILLTVSAAADPDDLEGGVFIVHQVPALAYSSEPPTGDWCTSYLPYAIGNCDQQVNRVEVTDRTRVTWFVLAAWYEPKTWCGTEFGFGSYDPLLFTFVDYGPCFPEQGLEIPTYDWPGPDHGTSLAAVGGPWSGNFIPVYAFFGYVYADPAPDRIPLDIDPGQGFGGTCDCIIPPTMYPALAYGALGINTDGIYACPEPPTPPHDRVCCVGDECLVLFSEGDCDAMGGTWHPLWTSCGPPNPCLVLPMVCCVGTDCYLVESWEECNALGGALLAGFHDCAPQPCGSAPAVCCVEGDCYILPDAERCDRLGGVWHPEWSSCEPDPCSPPSPIPATTWGAIKALYR